MFDRPILRGKPKIKKSQGGIVLAAASIMLSLSLALGWPNFFVVAVEGTLGIYAYALFFLLFWAGIGMKYSRRYHISPKYIVLASLMAVILFVSVHFAFTFNQMTQGFMEYLKYGFNNLTPGGVLFSIPAFALHAVFFVEGTFIILAIAFIVCTAFLVNHIVVTVGENRVLNRMEYDVDANSFDSPDLAETIKPDYSTKTRELHAVVDAKYQELLEKQSRVKLNLAKSELGLTQPPTNFQPTAIHDNPIPLSQLPSEQVSLPDQITTWSTAAAAKLESGLSMPEFTPSPKYQTPNYQAPNHNNWGYNPNPSYNAQAYNTQASYNSYPYGNPSTTMNYNQNESASTVQYPMGTGSGSIDDRINARSAMQGLSPDDRINARAAVRDRFARGESRTADRGGQLEFDVKARRESKVYRPKKYNKPPIDLIRTESSNLDQFRIDALEKQRLLDVKLKEFGVGAKVTNITVAPAVTRFEIQLAPGTRVPQVEQLQKDIAYVLGSQNIRIESPIEGKNAIGVEVPNKNVGCVSIKDILSSREFQTHKSSLAVAIGKNINDEIVVGDISTMPHLLIAGSTGSGKSVAINTILTSLLYHAHPDEVKLLLVDMKRVELNMYNEVPHMLIPCAIKEVDQAINALKWMQTEMQRRYDTLESHGVNNIGLYHALPGYVNGTLERMPYIVMVIDEAADLLAKGKREVEDSIKSLSALARACGIHIILATQRPDVNIITGVIKTNFTVRIAFKVSSRGDSVTIINNSGAEKLVGRGDMLFVKESHSIRVQGAFIELDETRKVMNYIRDNNESEFDPEIEDRILNGPPQENAATGISDFGVGNSRAQDPLFLPVLKWLVRDENYQRTASISSLQRQFAIGFAKAGKIIDQLAAAGYVSASNGTKTRQVLVSRDDVEAQYGA